MLCAIMKVNANLCPQRDATQRESLTTTLRTLKSDSQHTTTELERLTTKFGDATRKLGLADAAERALKLQLRSAEAAAKGLKEEMARMRSLVAQTRAMCANEVRKRERTIEGLKKHVGEGGRARGSGRAIGVATVTVNAGVGGGEGAGSGVDVVGEGYDLRSETNEFLTELASGLSEDNEKLGALLRRTVDSLKALSGWEVEGQQEGGLIVSTEEGYEAVAAEADNVLEHLRTLLTNPSFVPLEEVELREEEIFRLRDGWERMEARWRDAVKMMDGWRKRMAKTGQTINLEELKLGMSLSPVKEGDEEEEYRDTNDLEEEYEEGDTQADIDAMNDSQVPQGEDIDGMSDASSFEEEPEENLLHPQEAGDEDMPEEGIEDEEEDISGDEADYEQEQIRLREQEEERLRLEEEASQRAQHAVEEAKKAEEAERLRQLKKELRDEEDAHMKKVREKKRVERQAKEAEEAEAAKETAANKAEAAKVAREATEAKKRQQREEEELVRKQEQEKRKARQAKEAEEARAARDASATKRRQTQASKPPKESEARKKRKSAGDLNDESAKKRVASQEKVQPSLRSSTRTHKTEEAPSNGDIPADAPRSTRSTRSTGTAPKEDTPSSSPLPAPPKLSPLRQPKAASSEVRKEEPAKREPAISSMAEENTPELTSRPPLNRLSTSQQAMQFSPIKPSSLSREYHPSPILEAPSLAPSQPRTSTRKPSKAQKPWDENVPLSPVKQASISTTSATKLSATLSPSKKLAAPREALPQQSPLTMASIAAKLAATEREADAARVRAKLKAAKASRGAARTAAFAMASSTTTTKVPIKTGETPAKVEKEVEAEATERSERKRKPTSRASRSSRRRSTLSPWELESLMMGGVQESPSK